MPEVFVGLFVEAGVCIEGLCLLVDLVIGMVFVSTGNGVAGSVSPALLTGSVLALVGDPKFAWMDSKLVLSHMTCTSEVSSAASKENTTPFFEVSLILASGDLSNPHWL